MTTIVQLRDNRFDKYAPLFTREQEGASFVADKSDELPKQTVSEETWNVLKEFNGDTLAELVERGKDSVVVLSGTQHLNDKDRKKLRLRA